MKYPNQKTLHKLLNYNPNTGIFKWKYRPIEMFRDTKWKARNHKIWNKRYANKVAGAYDGRYINIAINGKQYKAHRLAYIYVYGKLSDKDEIDHKNRKGNDNRIKNLRCVDRTSNQLNLYKTSKNNSGVVGVNWDKLRNKWSVSICLKGKRYFVGRFIHFKDAVKARYNAELKYGFTKINPISTAYVYLFKENLV